LAEPIREMRRRDEKMLDGCPRFDGPCDKAHAFDEVATTLCASGVLLKGLNPLDQRVIMIGDKLVGCSLMHSHSRR